LTSDQADVTDDGLHHLVRDYTREAGVRNLERTIGAVLRSVAVRVAEGRTERTVVDTPDLESILGGRRFESEVAERTSVAGVATGLAWTPVGGDILFVEATRIPGKGRLILTGQLGDVMRESATAALSLVKSRAADLGIDEKLFEKSDIHVHVPAGAIPKDGPSAGVAMFTALASLMTNRKVRADTAMTGEISLRGLVLPVGGIKQKVVAAHAAGIRRVLLPARNRRDYDEIPEGAKQGLEFVWCERVDGSLKGALEDEPAPARETAAA
jgi:ATP-dependent Lon protease